MTMTYRVDGMTCAHCVAAVTKELMKVDGVNEVRVDLADGLVHVDCASAPDQEAVSAAVDEAGFELRTQ